MQNLSEPEKQIITSLAWFRTRYALFLGLDPDRPATEENLNAFGKAWMGNFKSDWSGSFKSLVDKGILSKSNGEYGFTKTGENVKAEVEADTPFFKYEYDLFFNTEQKSQAHSMFCKLVYGEDLSQHGLIDQNELSVLIDYLKRQKPSKILDLGCGNGKIAESLAKNIDAKFVGLDISSEGIKAANLRTGTKSNISFEVGNMNSLNFTETYDAILFLDTLYYSEDLKHTIQSALSGLSEQGCIYAYFSQWIMDEAYSENLLPHNTHLANVLKDLNLNYQFVDLTESGINHWKKKLRILEEMKQEFIDEGNEELWLYRYREAFRYANWGDLKYARYFYMVHRN